jgi:hypothetical protein
MIQLSLTVDQCNTILAALAEQPWKQVAELIGTLHQQAQGQLNQAPDEAVEAEPVVEAE